MKQIIFILSFVAINNVLTAQSPVEINDADLAKYKQEIQTEAQKLKQKLLKNDYLSDFNKNISVAFQVDTFLVERLLSKRISVDYSTAGMMKAAYDSETEYDRILNKYYLLLLGKLNDSGKEILKQSQRNWIRYRDGERKINNEIAKDVYSGGGSIQRIIVASRYNDITKQRAIELFNYLARFIE